MKLRISSLQIKCKRENYLIPFSDGITFIYGNTGVGKSTLLNLINYALGGNLVRTQIVVEEVISVVLSVFLNGLALTIHRKVNSNVICISHEGGSDYLQANDLSKRTLSDYFYSASGQNPIEMIGRKSSRGQKITFANFMWFAYLRQEELDNSFYYLGDQKNTFKEQASSYVLKSIFEARDFTLQECRRQINQLKEDMELSKSKLSIAQLISDTTQLSRVNITEEVLSKRRTITELEADRDRLYRDILCHSEPEQINALIETVHKIGMFEAEVRYLKEFQKVFSVKNKYITTLKLQQHAIDELMGSYNHAGDKQFEQNISKMEAILTDCFRKANFLNQDDHVRIDTQTFVPFVCDERERKKYDYYSLSSGGRRTIFKILYAFALYIYLKENGICSLIPDFLLIDTPMKNISEREDRKLQDDLYSYISSLFGAGGNLHGTQLIIVDKEVPKTLDIPMITYKRFSTNEPLIAYKKRSDWSK